MEETLFTIFVVEDDEWYNRMLVHSLSLDPENRVKSFYSGKELLGHLHEKPDIITLDYRLPDHNGAELLRMIRDFDENIEVIAISGQEDIEIAVGLLKQGAFDYLVKNNDIRERLLNTVSIIRNNSGLKKRIDKLEKEVARKYSFENAIIGKSPAMTGIHGMVEKAISSNITVSISGETGTGKEVVAKAIHFNSERKGRPFVPVNMTAIPSGLFESELFGHEKGSFTGAVTLRKGKFEEAHGGTLFLDEIGDTDLSFQPKLLRALQDRVVTRLGSNQPIRLDCRIIVATNRNLAEEVKNGRFRQDLYYRLLGLPIELPPLRDRGNDILILAHHFMESFCRENKMAFKPLSEEAMAKLSAYGWPGNVRELKSVVELALVMAHGEKIKAGDIMLDNSGVLPDLLTEETSLRDYSIRIVRYFLKKYNDDIKLVSEKLSIGQTTIYRMLKESRK